MTYMTIEQYLTELLESEGVKAKVYEVEVRYDTNSRVEYSPVGDKSKIVLGRIRMHIAFQLHYGLEIAKHPPQRLGSLLLYSSRTHADVYGKYMKDKGLEFSILDAPKTGNANYVCLAGKQTAEIAKILASSVTQTERMPC